MMRTQIYGRQIETGPLALRAVTVVVAVLVAGVALYGASGVAAGQSQQPGDPINIYGTITDESGEPIPGGTVVYGVVDGEVQDSIVVSPAGEFGGPTAGDGKLTIDTAAGEKVRFRVGSPTGRETAETVDLTNADPVVEAELTVPNDDDDDGSDDDDSGDDDSGDDDSRDDGSGDDSDDDQQMTPEPEVIQKNQIASELGDNLSLPPETDPVRAEQVAVVVSPDGSSTTATFNEESAVSTVEISDEVEGEVTVVEYEEEPDSVGKAPGQSVAVTQIAVPPEAEDTAGTVTSRISRARLDELGTEAENLRISRYSGNGWEILQTDVVQDSETELLVSADTPRGFSYFSVSVVSEPEAVITSDQTVAVGEQLTLDASMSSDRYGDILSYDWEVAGTQLTGETVTTTLDSSGEQSIRLTVTNDAGETDTVTEPLTVGRAGFQLSTFEDPETVTVESEFEVSGTVTNTGAVSGSQTIVYSFGDDRIERTVELASGESTQLSFTVTAPEQSGTYSGELTIAGNKTEADILVEKAADNQSSEQADDSSEDASDQTSPEEESSEQADDSSEDASDQTSPEKESSDGFGPGFGLIPAVVALISVAVLFGLRYRNHH